MKNVRELVQFHNSYNNNPEHDDATRWPRGRRKRRRILLQRRRRLCVPRRAIIERELGTSKKKIHSFLLSSHCTYEHTLVVRHYTTQRYIYIILLYYYYYTFNNRHIIYIYTYRIIYYNKYTRRFIIRKYYIMWLAFCDDARRRQVSTSSATASTLHYLQIQYTYNILMYIYIIFYVYDILCTPHVRI